MDEIIADRMPPMLAGKLRRIALIEHVPPSIPLAQAIRVVQPVFGAAEMVARIMRIL